MENYFSVPFKGNAETEYGKRSEPAALKAYSNKTGNVVLTTGLVVHSSLPWLGYSPDGLVLQNGVPEILLEVKSPVLGEKQSISDLVKQKKLSYLSGENENFFLKKKQSFYSQVQLGPFFLNLKTCHFYVHSHISRLLLSVYGDDSYIKEMLTRLYSVYFTHVLPKLAKAVRR